MMRRLHLPERSANKSIEAITRTTPLPTDRETHVAALTGQDYDLVIIGGGISGAYSALDAALRGLRVALIEKDDFASGTSSKSSKMIHGGLRYIEQGNLPLVRHSLLERQRLRRNAPHLVQRLPFLFPVLTQGGIFNPALASGFEALLWTYDLAGGWREGILHKKLSPNEVIARCPTLRREDVKSGFMYFDARADDARLTLDIVRTAMHHGAIAVNYAKATQVLRRGSRIVGVRAEIDGEEVDITCSTAIVAVGSWLRDWTGAQPGVETPHVRPAKGVHVAVPWTKIRNDCTVTITVPGRTRRATITRWGDVSVLGTTDEDYTGDLDEVNTSREEMDFLLEGANVSLTSELEPSDVLGSIAGTRPLVAPPGGKTVEMKRNAEIRRDPDGLITVAGGKLTTSRHMAEQAVDAAMTVLGRRARCRTAHAYLLGGAGFDPQASLASGGLGTHLAERYGTESMFVSEILANSPELAVPLTASQPYLEAEVVYAARHELARTVDDVLSRRTRLRLFARDESVRAAPRVAEILRDELGLSDAETQSQVDTYTRAVQSEKHELMGA